MLEAKKLTLAERCSIFLLDQESQELVAKVFDGVPAAEVTTLLRKICFIFEIFQQHQSC